MWTFRLVRHFDLFLFVRGFFVCRKTLEALVPRSFLLLLVRHLLLVAMHLLLGVSSLIFSLGL